MEYNLQKTHSNKFAVHLKQNIINQLCFYFKILNYKKIFNLEADDFEPNLWSVLDQEW